MMSRPAASRIGPEAKPVLGRVPDVVSADPAEVAPSVEVGRLATVLGSTVVAVVGVVEGHDGAVPRETGSHRRKRA